MSKIKLSKLDAARRQIDAAIRMTFHEEDPVAIHTVAGAARGILQSLCKKSGRIESFLRFNDWIRPGHEVQFWAAFNKSANFIKHADKDPEAEYDLIIEEADFLLIFCIKWYKELSGLRGVEIDAFSIWFIAQHPETINDDAS